MKKMKDLKAEVHERIQHLDGRLIDNMHSVSTDEMLGIIDPDEDYHPKKREGTILSPEHDFWDEYHRSVLSGRAAEEEVTYALLLLREEDKLFFKEPEEVDGSYVEVSPVETKGSPSDFDLRVEEVNTNLALIVEYEGRVYEGILHKK